MSEREFKGVWIPKEVWLDTRLNAADKVILAEIDSLDHDDRGCYASNKYIADFCQCSERSVSNSISKLIKYGYVRVQKFDGRQRELRSCIAKFSSQHSKNCEADTQNLREINIENNTENNTEIFIMDGTPKTHKNFVPPTVEEVRAYVQEKHYDIDAEYFVDYYTARGWLVGKTKMKDWRAAVRTWVRNGHNSQQTSGFSRSGGKTQSRPLTDTDRANIQATRELFDMVEGDMSDG